MKGEEGWTIPRKKIWIISPSQPIGITRAMGGDQQTGKRLTSFDKFDKMMPG